MAHGFGPLGSRAAAVRPDAARDTHGVQTWFQDASGPGKRDGTTINASWLNHIIGNLVYLCNAAGVPTQNNQGDDTYLFRAVAALARGEPPDLSPLEARVATLEDADFAYQDAVDGAVGALRADMLALTALVNDTRAAFATLATVAYVENVAATLRGGATTAGDTLGELEARLPAISQGTSG